MATGKIKVVYPNGNDGSRPGAAQITEDGTGIKYQFHTPDDNNSERVSAGNEVSFDITNGKSVSNVRVLAPTPAVTLTANPISVKVGESATLSWTSSNADEIIIDSGVGSVTPVASGSVTVAPRTTTTYTITANNSSLGQSASASVTVQVG